MYAPSHYRMSEPHKLHALMDAFPFATLVRNGANGPVLAQAPLARMTTPAGSLALIGHVARSNPFWDTSDGTLVVAAFAGPDAYISPSHYPSKAVRGEVVPTWNYLRVEARGILSVEASPERLRPYIDAPTAMMEQGRPNAWSAADAPEPFIEKLCRAIIGIRIEVLTLEGAWKLDQRKALADRQGAIEGLRREGQILLADAMAEH